MSLKPSEWVAGMTVGNDLCPDRFLLLERKKGSRGYGWFVRGGISPFIHDTSFTETRCRPMCYADLSREPVEGERAVLVDPATSPCNVGSVWTHHEISARWSREGMSERVYWEATNLAPLTTSEPPRLEDQPEHDHPLGHDEPTHAAECERPHGERGCAYWYLTYSRGLLDPCQPCATLIDSAEHHLAWYAEGRCRVCGFKSKCFCKGR